MKKRAEDIFRKHGGQLRMSEALEHGITRYMLYSLRDKGVLDQVSRGIYRLVELPPISNPDLVTVSLRFPNAVVCLVSALSFSFPSADFLSFLLATSSFNCWAFDRSFSPTEEGLLLPISCSS